MFNLVVATTCWEGIKPHFTEIIKISGATMVASLTMKSLGKNNYSQLIKGTGVLYCCGQVAMLLLSLVENPPVLIKVLKVVFAPIIKLFTR